jgi:hypothetical protein
MRKSFVCILLLIVGALFSSCQGHRPTSPKEIVVTPEMEKNAELISAAIPIGDEASLGVAKFLYAILNVSELAEVNVVAKARGFVIMVTDNENNSYKLAISPYGGVDAAWKEGVEEPIFFKVE